MVPRCPGAHVDVCVTRLGDAFLSAKGEEGSRMDMEYPYLWHGYSALLLRLIDTCYRDRGYPDTWD